jgi:hypothetical protein
VYFCRCDYRNAPLEPQHSRALDSFAASHSESPSTLSEIPKETCIDDRIGCKGKDRFISCLADCACQPFWQCPWISLPTERKTSGKVSRKSRQRVFSSGEFYIDHSWFKARFADGMKLPLKERHAKDC